MLQLSEYPVLALSGKIGGSGTVRAGQRPLARARFGSWLSGNFREGLAIDPVITQQLGREHPLARYLDDFLADLANSDASRHTPCAPTAAATSCKPPASRSLVPLFVPLSVIPLSGGSQAGGKRDVLEGRLI